MIKKNINARVTIQLLNSINLVLLLLLLLPYTSAQSDDDTTWFPDVRIDTKKELLMLVCGVVVFIGCVGYLTWLSVKAQMRIMRKDIGLDPKVIETFPVIAYSDVKKIKNIKGTVLENCSVCLNEFGDEDMLRLLPCQHVFHPNDADCIDGWFASHSTCPVCRFDYKPTDFGISPNAGDAVIDVNHRWDHY
ncbi:hypothetical protein MKX01_011808 [Papaver californicum]|nr:hypothetical protein MKX01_011808 [Papaver californicum]